MYLAAYSRKYLHLLLVALFVFAGAFAVNTVDAASKNYTAYARCSETGKTGKASSKSLRKARINAVNKCVANGGIRGCCSVTRVLKPAKKK